MATTQRVKKKSKRLVPIGQLHVKATFNNTIVTISDKNGEVLASSSSGACGFRGGKKGTAYAAQVAAEQAATKANQNHGVKSLDVFVKGIGLGRDAAIRAMAAGGIKILSIRDVTGIPHGGCRPRKARRA